MTEVHKVEQDKDRYRNRRKMAWFSFYSFSGLGVGLILIGLVNSAIVHAIWPQAMFTMGLWGSVVAGYFTVTWNTDKAEITSASKAQEGGK